MVPSSTPFLSSSGRIAFSSQRIDYDNPEIFIMKADGSEQTRLTEDSLNNEALVWSPNGQMIAFVTHYFYGENYFSKVQLINIDGTGLITLTPRMGDFRDQNWSPDSNSLVFESGDGEIYTVWIDGSHYINLTQSPSIEHDPQWSPVGSRIFFVSNIDGSSNVFSMKPDGTDKTRLSDFKSEDSFHITLSPDGSKLAIVGVDENYNSKLYVMNPDGSGFKLLAGRYPYNNEISWSPSSDKIAFVSGPTDNLNIYAINSDGSELHKLTWDNWCSAPAWSPDGSRIAYMCNSERSYYDFNFDIYLMNSDGSLQTRLTEELGIDGEPVWEP